jgi:hypothetical protein
MMAHRIKIYADTDKEKNKFFVFIISSPSNVLPALRRLRNSGMIIRAVWYEDTKQCRNEKIDLWNL